MGRARRRSGPGWEGRASGHEERSINRRELPAGLVRLNRVQPAPAALDLGPRQAGWLRMHGQAGSIDYRKALHFDIKKDKPREAVPSDNHCGNPTWPGQCRAAPGQQP